MAAVIVLLSAAAAAAPAPAATSWEQDPETSSCGANSLKTVEVTLPSLLTHRLSEIPSREGRDAARFLSGHLSMPFRLAFMDYDRAQRLGRAFFDDPNTPVYYDRERAAFGVSHRLLHLDGRDERSFIQSPQAQRELAQLTALGLVHEVSHAREQEWARGRLPKMVEDEMVAFYKSFLFAADAIGADEGFDRMKEALSLQRKVNGLFKRYDGVKGSGAAARAARAKIRAELLAIKPSYTQTVTPLRFYEVAMLSALSESSRDFEWHIQQGYQGKVGSLTAPEAEIKRLKQELAEHRADMKRLGSSASGGVVAVYERDIAY